MYTQRIIAVVVITVIFLMETFFPYRKDIKNRYLHLGRNGFFAIINGIFTSAFNIVILLTAMYYAEKHSLGLLRSFDLFPFLSFGLAFIIFDLWMYVWHRVNHNIYFLWLFHRVHHSDPVLDMSSSFRFHPIEIIISSVLNVIFFVLIGISLEQIALYSVIFHANVLFHHSNIDLPEKIDRIVRYVFVTPNMHRVHHSIKRVETDSNYASVFSFWDRMFLSYKERDVSLIVYGLKFLKEDKWQNIIGLLKMPFLNKNKIKV